MTVRTILVALAGCLATVVLAGCNVEASKDKGGDKAKPEPTPIAEVGQECLVQFRRDALGAASRHPIGPGTGTVGDSDMMLTGTFQRMDSEWLVIRLGMSDIFIPREMILLVEVMHRPEPEKPAPKADAGAPTG